MNQDRLLEILLSCLEQNSSIQNHEELMVEVVGQYMYELMQTAHIPHHCLDTMEEYLKEEALEMYRKKTYGYLNLKDFRKR